MPKTNYLDRLAGAMKTLNKRQGKNLTPRQRVAAAQRWNSLADAGDHAEDMIWDEGISDEAIDFTRGIQDLGLKTHGWNTRPDNPFLSDNISKYAEQSDFLDWCRYNGLEPNGRSLKTFRWERYRGMSIPKRERIYDAYDPYFLPEEKMWYSRSDMPDYLPVGWDEVE